MTQFMRAHGNTPGPTQRPYAGGALAGAAATLAAGPFLWMFGAIPAAAAALRLGTVWVALLQGATLVVAGAVYGRVFNRAAGDRRGGWLFGISYGYLVWMLGPATTLQWLAGEPLAKGTAGLALLGGHVLWGGSWGCPILGSTACCSAV